MKKSAGSVYFLFSREEEEEKEQEMRIQVWEKSG